MENHTLDLKKNKMDTSGTIVAFDLDGTITKKEILPIIAKELNLEKEIELLTKLTLSGVIDFRNSFKLRVELLRNIPISRVQEIIAKVPLDKNIEAFIKSNKEHCVIVTGNLDIWIQPILERLGCKFYCSKATMIGDQLKELDEILIKNMAINNIQRYADKVIAVGESTNDIPMFQNSDIGIAFGGVHNPVSQLIEISDYVVFKGGALCKLLNTLL